jgi:CelD/BcsL family acetyltransferase involved in cellulose biosynthesis
MTTFCPESLGTVREFSTVEPLRGAWNDLLQRSYDKRIFFTPLWFETWLHHVLDASPHILVLGDPDSELQGVLPLQCIRQGNGLTITFLGDSEVSDYMDGVADKDTADEVLEILWNCALDGLQWNRIEVRHVPSTSPSIGALERVLTSRGLTCRVEADGVCPVAILCNTWDGYLDMLSKKQRHEIRWKVRRCEDVAQIVWRTTRDRSTLQSDLDVFFHLHRASAGAKASFMTPEMQEYFRELAEALLNTGALRLSTLERNGVPVASTMGFLHLDRYMLYNSAFDPAQSAFSPGIAAVAHAMQDAIADRAALFDFLTGDEPYKYHFGAQNTYTCRITATR